MSDLENELLGLAEDDPSRHRQKRGGGSGGRKGKDYVDSDGGSEESMDIDDSDDDDAPTQSKRPMSNPYPLEGQYIDEDDRDRLESLPEIERENILASRQEEIQKYKDAAQLEAMYKMTGKEEDDDEDDTPARKRRKHTSVTTEASRAMMELKNRRKAKGERVQRRAERRRDRPARSTSPGASGDEASSEEGEIPAGDEWRRSPRRTKEEKHEVADLDSVKATWQEVNAARVSRYELVDMMYKDKFEETIIGAYVRLMAPGEVDEAGRQKYRVHRITGIDKSHDYGRYSMEYQGRQVLDDRALVCQYGLKKRLYRIADVSNGDFDEGEFGRFSLVLQADKMDLPKRSDLIRKKDQIAALRDRPMTEDEVNRQVEARKQANPAQRQRTVLQVTSLMSSKQLAIRRNDHATAEAISKQIIELGADPTTGELLSGELEISEKDKRIQQINENNRRKTRETMNKAHEASLAKKKAEDAIIKAKSAKANGIDEKVARPPPISGLKRGETPQQYVARTIVLDLGDF